VNAIRLRMIDSWRNLMFCIVLLYCFYMSHTHTHTEYFDCLTLWFAPTFIQVCACVSDDPLSSVHFILRNQTHLISDTHILTLTEDSKESTGSLDSVWAELTCWREMVFIPPGLVLLFCLVRAQTCPSGAQVRLDKPTVC